MYQCAPYDPSTLFHFSSDKSDSCRCRKTSSTAERSAMRGHESCGGNHDKVIHNAGSLDDGKLVGGFNPLEKYVGKKNILKNHHPEKNMFIKVFQNRRNQAFGNKKCRPCNDI